LGNPERCERPPLAFPARGVTVYTFLPLSFQTPLAGQTPFAGKLCREVHWQPIRTYAVRAERDAMASSAAAGNARTGTFSDAKSGLISIFEWFGELGLFCWRLLRSSVLPPYEWQELFRQCDAIGAKSLPLVALAGAATGVVLSLETRDSLDRFGARAMLPVVIVFSIVKETGPVITGLVVSGRVGAGIGAELGSMRVTEQIDAMEASAVDPFKYLVATRVLACVMMLPLLTVASNFCGILMGWVTTTLAEPISLRLFFENGFKSVLFSDFIPPVAKTTVYGFIIGIVSCFQGMRTKGGTEGVGRSATSSVVLSSLFVILADVLLVRLILTVWG
jgi:phospholipid/cholesterol/gamma-HCH transport system permease protein